MNDEAYREALDEIERLRHEVLEWKLVCGRRDEDMDKDVLTVVRERDDARTEAERLREALDKPLRETILAVLRTMPAEAAPEHLAAMIEWQVKGWQKWQNITAFPSGNRS